jgi:hypothetical protein
MNTITRKTFYFAAIITCLTVVSSTKTLAQYPPVIFDFCTVYGEPGDTVCVPIKCTNFTDISTMQWTMHFDTSFMKFVEDSFNVELSGVFDWTTAGGGVNQGVLIMSWFTNSGQISIGTSLSDGDIVAELCFEIQQNASGYSEIEVSGTPIVIEVLHIYLEEATPFFNQGGVQIGEAPPMEEVTLGFPFEVPICQDSTGFLCADIPAHFPTQGIQYHWYTEDGTPVESNSTSGCLAVTASTTGAYTSYYCEITPPIPCNDTLYRSALITAVEQDVETCELLISASEVKKSTPLHIHPNPTSGTFTLTLPTGVSEDMQVKVFNLYGQQVMQSSLGSGTTQLSLDASHLPAGVYWVSVYFGSIEMYGGKLAVFY